MPNPLIQKYSKETGLSPEEIESKWDSAKKYVSDELHISKEEGDKYWKAVTGTLKHWLRGKLKKEEFEQFFVLLEQTVTGDIVKYDQPLGRVTRNPDGTTFDGSPYFAVKDKYTVSKILDGKKKNKRWKELIEDKGIHDWANKHYLKSFYIQTPEGLYIKVR